MSAPDASSPNAAPNSATSGDEPRRSGGSSTRLIVLLLILLVAGAAAGWDYLIARPGYEQALEKVEPLLPTSDRDADEGASRPAAPKIATQEDVHGVLDAEPAVTETAGAYVIERYSWRRGLPWLTYDLWVIYDDDAARTLRNATSVRAEADLYYATARQADSPAPGSDPLNESSADASEPAKDATEPSADAKADDAEPPAEEAPETAADES
jgi:hypothetical protein